MKNDKLKSVFSLILKKVNKVKGARNRTHWRQNEGNVCKQNLKRLKKVGKRNEIEIL